MNSYERNALLQIYPNSPDVHAKLSKHPSTKLRKEDSLEFQQSAWRITLNGISEFTGTAYGPRDLEGIDAFMSLIDSLDCDYHVEVFEDSGRLVKRYLK